jgi:hypothetical protein
VFVEKKVLCTAYKIKLCSIEVLGEKDQQQNVNKAKVVFEIASLRKIIEQ